MTAKTPLSPVDQATFDAIAAQPKSCPECGHEGLTADFQIRITTSRVDPKLLYFTPSRICRKCENRAKRARIAKKNRASAQFGPVVGSPEYLFFCR